MTQATETRYYDVSEQFEAEAKPIIEQLKAVCEKLGVPLLVRAWTGAGENGVTHDAVLDAHRNEVHASFASAVIEANAHSVMEKVMRLMHQGGDEANWYQVNHEVDEDGDAGFRLEPVAEED